MQRGHWITQMGHKMTQLLALTPEVGWQEALDSTFPELKQYISRKAPFLACLPIEGADVLEIGPGFGQFTSQIAATAKGVHALEVDEGQAEFLAERLRQEGARNVHVSAGGADCLLPYPNESFDLIILNLVFEWCAIRMNGDHSEGQERLLDEMRRVLRPGGKLYLATKNRFALRYLMGKADEHFGGMRFGSALPRALARTLNKARQKGKLYSYRGMTKLLRKHGFEVLQTWWAAPEMRWTEEMVPTDVPSVRKARRLGLNQGATRSERLIMRFVPARLVKHFTPGLAFLAEKQC